MNRDKVLFKMVKQYFRTCNRAYNRIATGKDAFGKKVPANNKQVDRINYTYKFELQWLKDVAWFDGYKVSEVNKAIKKYKLAMR